MIESEASTPEVPAVDGRVDIRSEVCPMTYVRTKLALERLEPGQVLEVILRGDEPFRNVPRNAREEGHEVLGPFPHDGGAFRLLIKKNRS